jgi:hypothetical protein
MELQRAGRCLKSAIASILEGSYCDSVWRALWICCTPINGVDQWGRSMGSDSLLSQLFSPLITGPVEVLPKQDPVVV